MFERDTVIEPVCSNLVVTDLRSVMRMLDCLRLDLILLNLANLMKLRKMRQWVSSVPYYPNIDVIGILKEVGEPNEITSKTTQKAVITLSKFH